MSIHCMGQMIMPNLTTMSIPQGAIGTNFMGGLTSATQIMNPAAIPAEIQLASSFPHHH